MSALHEEISLIRQGLNSPYGYALAALAMVLSPQLWSGSWATVATLSALALALALQSVIDLKTFQLPHLLNGLTAILGLTLAALNHQPLALHLASGLTLGILFLAMGLLASHYAKKPALGGGDIYLAAALGTTFGLGGIPPFFLLVALFGFAVVLVRRLRPRTPQFPFGPILALSGWLTLLYQGIYWKCIASFTA